MHIAVSILPNHLTSSVVGMPDIYVRMLLELELYEKLETFFSDIQIKTFEQWGTRWPYPKDILTKQNKISYHIIYNKSWV